jgi:glutathione synthase/RimK-type ligase-like ATP-grasp enzyme
LVSTSKFNQLKVAQEVGFQTPATLIGNEPNTIRDFVRRIDKACFKPTSGYVWKSQGKVTTALTAPISSEDLQDPRELTANAAIYQAFIPKQAEYRVTVFGNFYAATRLENSGGSDDEDWRVSSSYLQRLSNVELPDDVIQRCKAVLSRLGIRFGTFDLLENLNGEFVFLEVNESGSFLWQEEFCEDVCLLEPFVNKSERSENLSYQSCARVAVDSEFYDQGIVANRESTSRFFTDEDH